MRVLIDIAATEVEFYDIRKCRKAWSFTTATAATVQCVLKLYFIAQFNA